MRLHTRLRYAPAEVHVENRAGGTMVLRSPQTLKPYTRAVGDWLVHWYERAPDRTFIAERKGDAWRRVTYRDALSDVRRIGQGHDRRRALLGHAQHGRGIGPRPEQVSEQEARVTGQGLRHCGSVQVCTQTGRSHRSGAVGFG